MKDQTVYDDETKIQVEPEKRKGTLNVRSTEINEN